VPISDVMTVRLVEVPPDATVRSAVSRMSEANVGAVVVCDRARLVGIFTERDVLRLAGAGRALDDLRVGEVMTRDVVSVSPDDDVLAAARLMGERRIRHLPVVQGEHVLGVVGIRDVVAALAERLWRHDEAAHETVSELLQRSPSG
jgi:CBS domain-containing protein